MVGKLPELFGRNFAVGYFLPATVFFAASACLLDRYGTLSIAELWRFVAAEQPFWASFVTFLLVWLLAISLLAANTWIIRRKEGYIRWKPLRRWMTRWERRRFRKIEQRIVACKRSGSDARPLLHEQATAFPHREDLLLPWKFGNAIRAFEAYPRVVYGFEATRGWSRLLAVIPEDYRDLTDAVKAEMDFLVNLWFLSCLFFWEYFALAWYTGRFEVVWVPLAAFASIRMASYWSLGAAVRWGEMVKGAFDVFLPGLRSVLGLKEPASRAEERRLWEQMSDAFLTRQPMSLPGLQEPCPRSPKAESAPVELPRVAART